MFTYCNVYLDERTQFQRLFNSLFVPIELHYPVPLLRHAAYEALCRFNTLPVSSERMAERVMSLPLSPRPNAGLTGAKRKNAKDRSSFFLKKGLL